MAIWHVEQQGSEIVLTYQEGAVRKPCGRGEVELEPDLIGWVIEQSSPWDRVQTPAGSFVRQVASEVRV